MNGRPVLMKSLSWLSAILSLAVFSSAAAESVSSGGPQWRPGVDYVTLVPAQRTTASPGKIEVRVRRYYMDDWMPSFEKALDQWAKTAPDDVEVVYARGIQSPVEFYAARMDMTLRALNRIELTGLPYYNWIHNPDHVLTYKVLWGYVDKNGIDRLNMAFAQANGIDAQAFLDIYHSRILDYRVDNEAGRSGPDLAIVIDGVYATSLIRCANGNPAKTASAENLGRVFRLVERLISIRRETRASRN